MKTALYLIFFIFCTVPLNAQNKHEDAVSLENKNEDEKKYLLKYEPVVVKNLTVNIEIDTTGFSQLKENYDVVFNKERRGIFNRFVENVGN